MTRDSRANRLLVLTQHYQPEPNFITTDVAQRLSQHSEVIVVTAHPNYPKGKFFPGTRCWWPEKRREGAVTVWRLPFFPDHSLSPYRRALSYLSFTIVAALFAPFVAWGARTVWVYQGPFTTAIAALWFKAVHGARIVYTAADLWPESMLATGVARTGLVVDMMFLYRRMINRAADLIICCTTGTRDRYELDGIPASRLSYVPVWVDGIGKSNPEYEPARQNLVYAGNLGPAQKLDTLIRAAARLHKDSVPILVDIYGSGASEEELKSLARELDAANVFFHGRVTPADAFRHSGEAFAQVVSLQPSRMFRMTVPSKLSFAFAAAAPILYGLEGEAAALAEASGGALRFDAEDPDSLVDAVLTLLARSPQQRREMRANLREYYDNNFAAPTLLSRYMDLVSPRRVMPSPVAGLVERIHADPT